MKISRLNKYLILAFRKSFLPSFFLLVLCAVAGYFKASKRDGIDLSPENIERLIYILPVAYLCFYLFIFCGTMWDYYINDGFVKDEEIKYSVTNKSCTQGFSFYGNPK